MAGGSNAKKEKKKKKQQKQKSQRNKETEINKKVRYKTPKKKIQKKKKLEMISWRVVYKRSTKKKSSNSSVIPYNKQTNKSLVLLDCKIGEYVHIRACQSPLPVAKILPAGLKSIDITGGNIRNSLKKKLETHPNSYVPATYIAQSQFLNPKIGHHDL